MSGIRQSYFLKPGEYRTQSDCMNTSWSILNECVFGEDFLLTDEVWSRPRVLHKFFLVTVQLYAAKSDPKNPFSNDQQVYRSAFLQVSVQPVVNWLDFSSPCVLLFGLGTYIFSFLYPEGLEKVCNWVTHIPVFLRVFVRDYSRDFFFVYCLHNRKS